MILTDTRIKSLRPQETPFRITDGESLYLFVKPNGSKLWQFRYRFSGKQRTLSIGPYPRVSLQKARQKRIEAQDLLRQKIDPSAHKQLKQKEADFRAHNTFEAVAREWHQHKSLRWSPRYSANTLRRLELHIFPLIGKRPIEEIKPLEILEVAQLQEKKGNTDMSHRVLEILNAVFRRAVVTGRLERNPSEHLRSELLVHTVENHPALPEEELANFLLKLQGIYFNTETTRLAVWLLLLTAVRQCELRFSKKSDIDFEKREWVLRPEITKMRRPHIVSLSSQAITVLRRLFEETSDSEWLVPSTRTKVHPVMSANTINQVIRRMGFEGKVVGHGFRSTFSTILNDHGFDAKIVDRQLAHVGRDKIEAAYNRADYSKQREDLMQWWGDFLDSKLPPSQRIVKTKGSQQYVSSITKIQVTSASNPVPIQALQPEDEESPGPKIASSGLNFETLNTFADFFNSPS